MHKLLPEWLPQWGVMIAWPHEDTDWRDNLKQAEISYLQLVSAITDYENALIICRNQTHQEHIESLLNDAGIDLEKITLLQRSYNDTWARDYGPIAVSDDKNVRLLDFTFTGWGNKFEASLDNRVSASIDWQYPLTSLDFVLEGGAIETDGNGLLLTTEKCILNHNRNGELTREQKEQQLKQQLGVSEIAWLRHGDLEGDDTDAHIDTLARFCNETTIAYVQCQDPSDSHYDELSAMETELKALAEQKQLTLVALPHPPAQFHSTEGYRLPATYANFLIINGAVLMPTYQCATDQQALAQLQSVFTDRRVIGVDCRAIIEQHGSLHCITMQLPSGVL